MDFFQAGDVCSARMTLYVRVQELQREMKKGRPNMVHLDDSMSRTYAAKRKWIATDLPSVSVVTDVFLALTLRDVVNFSHFVFPTKSTKSTAGFTWDVISSRRYLGSKWNRWISHSEQLRVSGRLQNQ